MDTIMVNDFGYRKLLGVIKMKKNVQKGFSGVPPFSIGPIMMDIEGKALTKEDRALLSHPLVGGVILFARNIETPEQVEALLADMRSVSPNTVLAVDQEGGRVQRIKEGVTRLPPLAAIGERYSHDPEAGVALCRACGTLMASEMLALGFDISFAPVLDIEVGVSEVIGDRAFGSTPEQVIELGRAYIEGMQAAGMAATGKHFPGHGGVRADSHLEMPVDEREAEQILAWDLQPFKALATLLQGVMPAHVIYPNVCDQPAGFSVHWLQTVLRQQLNFDGVIFSDDLSMEGAKVAGTYLDRAVAALKAGCDMVLVCNQREEAVAVIEGLQAKMDQPWLVDAIRAGQPRLKRLLGRSQYRWCDYQHAHDRVQLKERVESIQA